MPTLYATPRVRTYGPDGDSARYYVELFRVGKRDDPGVAFLFRVTDKARLREAGEDIVTPELCERFGVWYDENARPTTPPALPADGDILATGSQHARILAAADRLRAALTA